MSLNMNKREWIYLLFFCVLELVSVAATSFNNGHCHQIDIFYSIQHCLLYDTSENAKVFSANSISESNIYILYDINPVEGFNLRRDVYIRMAVFLKLLRSKSGYINAKLVLPTFQRLYHWKSSDITQSQVFWNHFFDLESLKQFTAVMDIWEYFEEIKKLTGITDAVIDHLFKLKNFDDFFDENGKFYEKYQIERSKVGRMENDKLYFGYSNFTVKQEHIVSYQGNVMMVHELLEQFRNSKSQKHFSIFIDHAEIVLHDHWGNADFWQARRSMRFNADLVAVANQYRELKFQSNNEIDRVQRPNDWQMEKPYRKAIGGNYICAHLRRADFLYGRERTTPTLRSAANQIKQKLREHSLDNVFISTDCSKKEYKDLRSFMPRVTVYRFTPSSKEEREQLKDGGIAIIDQIICSHARYFIGTFESTFTYRIYEEREILGFAQKTTFNTFCKNDSDMENCEKNSVWPIEY